MEEKVVPGWAVAVGTWASDADFSTLGVDVLLESVRTWKLCRWTR